MVSVIKHFVLICIAAIMVFPFVWMVSTSLKDTYAVYSYPPKFFSWPLEFANYQSVWTSLPFGAAFLNSLTITVLIVFFQLFTASMAAFSFAKLKFKGRETLFILILATMMIPEQVTMIPLFKMFTAANLIDTHWALILPGAFCYPFGVFMLRQFIKGLPDALMEAARIDGCSYPKIYYKIILPLSKSSIMALLIFSFLQNWNSFLYPLLFLNTQEKFTLPLMLNIFKGLYFTNWPVLMAAAGVVVIPVIIVYLIAQKYIIEGIAITGMKG